LKSGEVARKKFCAGDEESFSYWLLDTGGWDFDLDFSEKYLVLLKYLEDGSGGSMGLRGSLKPAVTLQVVLIK
jgi:hypothetical protein